MTIKELKEKHLEIADWLTGLEVPHTKLSIEFAISVLEDLEA